MLHYLRRGNRLLPSTGKFLGDCCLTQMPPFPQWITGGVGVMRCDGLLKPHAFFWGFYPSIVIMGRIFSSVRCFKQETVVCNRNSREETRAISACLSYSLAVWFRVNYQVPATPFIYVESRSSDADSAEPLRGIMWWSLGPYFGSPANKSLLLDRWRSLVTNEFANCSRSASSVASGSAPALEVGADTKDPHSCLFLHSSVFSFYYVWFIFFSRKR